jgi:hypothetical protein
MQAPRPGSRKAVVFHAFKDGGLKQAEHVGTEMGLKTGTIRSWVGGWSKQEAAGPNTPRRSNAHKAYLKFDPEREPIEILAEGDEQTEIRWSDGTRGCVSNRHIVKA